MNLRPYLEIGGGAPLKRKASYQHTSDNTYTDAKITVTGDIC